MLILLSDGSGLTSRQVATRLSRAGHTVEAVSPTRLGPAGFTRHVRRIHRVPAFGADPEAWLEATLAVLRGGGHDVLLPTQEQVTILARDAHRLPVPAPLPVFAALERVQDKVAQVATLAELGLAHPPSVLAATGAELAGVAEPPVYVKTAIGTASAGVRRVADRAALATVARELDTAGAFAFGPVVVQEPVAGPLVMVQAVYDAGRLVAWHANLREVEGHGGGSAVKRSVALPAAAADLERLGAGLGWHGALSADAILTPGGPVWIDLNPRLVEPGNAWAAGTDLVGALLDVALGRPPESRPPGRPGVRTHQLLLGVLGAADRGTRRGVVAELARAATHRGPYAGSREELTPLRGDPRAAIPVLAAAALALARPSAAHVLSGGAVRAYAVTPRGWQRIRAGAATAPAFAPGSPA